MNREDISYRFQVFQNILIMEDKGVCDGFAIQITRQVCVFHQQSSILRTMKTNCLSLINPMKIIQLQQCCVMKTL